MDVLSSLPNSPNRIILPNSFILIGCAILVSEVLIGHLMQYIRKIDAYGKGGTK